MSARNRAGRERNRLEKAAKQVRHLNPKVPPPEMCWCGCGHHWHRGIPGLRKMTPDELAAWKATDGRYGHEAQTPKGYGPPVRRARTHDEEYDE